MRAAAAAMRPVLPGRSLRRGPLARSLARSLAGQGEALPAPEPCGRHAQRPPPASAPPASREQPRRARAPTAGVVMAAAPSLTAALRGAGAERAGGPRASRRARGAGSHLNPRRAAHSRQEQRGPACHLPGSSLPRHRGCPGTLRPFRRLPYVLAGGKGGRGSSGTAANWKLTRTFPPRMPDAKAEVAKPRPEELN